MQIRTAFISSLVVMSLACGDDGTGGTSASGGSGGAGGAGGSGAEGTGASGGAGGGGSGGGSGEFTSEGESSFETQTTLAADEQGNVVVVWVAVYDDGASSIGYATSQNDGSTWTAPSYVSAPGDRLSTGPVIAVDSAGTFTLAWLGFRLDFNNPDEHVYVATLDPAVGTFSAPVNASDDGASTLSDYDRPSIAIDANDEVLLTWADFTSSAQGTPASLVFARSGDAMTFARTTIVNDSTFGNLAHLCLDRAEGPSATLYLVHLAKEGTLTLRTSVDTGSSWELAGTPSASKVVFQPPSCTVRGNVVSLVYGAGDALFDPSNDSPADRIELNTSSDGGAVFSSPIVIAPEGATQYLFPRVAKGASGAFEVAYYEGIVGADAMFMHASSEDGTTWTNAEIAPAGTMTTDLTLASWLGGVVGVASPGTTGLVSYAENSQAKTHIAFAQVAIP